MQYGTIETPDGSVLRLDTRTLASDQEMRTFGDVVDDQMTLTLEGRASGSKRRSPGAPTSAAPTPPSRACRASR